MKNSTKVLIGVIVVVVLAIVYSAIKSSSQITAGAASATGTYNNGTFASQIVLLPTTSNGTSTSILNTSSSDRAVTSTSVFCTGVGTSQSFGAGAGLLSTGWTLTAATTTSASSGLGTNANYILNTSVATTSGIIYVASSTEGVLPYWSRVWPTATYLTFNFNATNTAACSLQVNYSPL